MEFDDFSGNGFGDHLSGENPRSRRRRKRDQRGRRILIIFLVAICLFAGLAYAGYRISAAFLVQAGDAGTGGALGGLFNRDAEEKDQTVNILLLGTDERQDEPGRSDTIVLAVLDTKSKSASLLSLPRDTRVEIAGENRTDKINYAAAKGGPKLAAETVENFLGIPVDSYVETNFEGFKEIIDTLGGVTIDVEKRMYRPTEDINLRPGLQRLDGRDALAYVRWRGDASADIGRVQRQQKFFLAVADEVLQVNNVWKLPDLVREFRDNVKTNLSLSEMLKLATAFKDMDKTNIQTYMVPGDAEYIDGISYWVPREMELEKIMEQIKSPAGTDQQQVAAD